MADSQTQREQFSPARIRMMILGAFETQTGWLPEIVNSDRGGIVNNDPVIEKKHLQPIIESVSKRIGLDVVFMDDPPRHGRKFTIASLTTYVFDNQGNFDPLPPEQPEEPTQNSNL